MSNRICGLHTKKCGNSLGDEFQAIGVKMTAHNLLERTRELLINRPRSLTYKDIARDLEVSERFLEYLASGRSEHASVTNVQKLYEYLSGKSLPLD